MDTDGTLDITFDEWRNYLLYAPSTDIRDIIGYWRHSTVSTSHFKICFAQDRKFYQPFSRYWVLKVNGIIFHNQKSNRNLLQKCQYIELILP